ncbi:hypothetical protein OF83DRAFT_1180092 [Amylostereum chailletii]|nr:hypothetical protein OF83DRAFT_1180092 [Amylostereum chailletii]
MSSANFPTDVARYEFLRSRVQEGELSTVVEVVEGMGEMLERVHWIGGYDGRDIEFTMGGTGHDFVRCYVFDFNQIHSFDVHLGDFHALVDLFFANDPYYPRPRPDENLYKVFGSAYCAACLEELRPRD